MYKMQKLFFAFSFAFYTLHFCIFALSHFINSGLCVLLSTSLSTAFSSFALDITQFLQKHLKSFLLVSLITPKVELGPMWYKTKVDVAFIVHADE